MSFNYPNMVGDVYYRAPKENPSYGAAMPQDFPYDPGATSTLFELNYFPKQGASFFPLIILGLSLFAFIYLIFKKKFRTLSSFFSLAFICTLALVFFGPLNLPSFFRLRTTLGLVKFLALILLLISFFQTFLRKKVDFLYARSFLPLSCYAISLLSSIFFITNLNFFLADLDIAFSGLLFFYLGFYFYQHKEGEKLLRLLAYLILFPSFIVLLTFVFKNIGRYLVVILYPRYENFVFLHDLDRGRIFSIIDFEYFIPCIFYLFLYKKRGVFNKAASLIIFIFASMTIFLVNYRYRFLIYIAAFLAVFALLKKSRKILLKVFVSASVFLFGCYLLISLQLGRLTLIDRFLLKSYRDDVDSLRRRFVMTQQAWDLFTQFPIFGVGLGNYKDNVQVYYEMFGGRTYEPYYKILQNVYAYPHNWYLLVLAENGLVGFFILCWLLYRFLKIDLLLHKKLKGGELLAFSTLSTISWLYIFANFFTMMHNSLPMVIFFWATRGMIERINYDKRKKIVKKRKSQ